MAVEKDGKEQLWQWKRMESTTMAVEKDGKVCVVGDKGKGQMMEKSRVMVGETDGKVQLWQRKRMERSGLLSGQLMDNCWKSTGCGGGKL